MIKKQITLESLSREELLLVLRDLSLKSDFVRQSIFEHLKKLNEKSNLFLQKDAAPPFDITNKNSAFVEKTNLQKNVATSAAQKIITRESSSQEKVELFMSLFCGRTDVFALRFQSKNGKSGYAPVCKNRFLTGKCNLKEPCQKCSHRAFLPLSKERVFNHLRGADENCRDVIGAYAILPSGLCNFLAMDFDKGDFKNDVAAVNFVCKKFGIPLYFEISRSGRGLHLWFFFAEKIPAKAARNFGALLIKNAMTVRHEISFSTFEKMFPSQDELPQGEFENLIALPLQGRAVANGHSVFVDENFLPYADQWKFLSRVRKLNFFEIENFSIKLQENLPHEFFENVFLENDFSADKKNDEASFQTNKINEKIFLQNDPRLKLCAARLPGGAASFGEAQSNLNEAKNFETNFASSFQKNSNAKKIELPKKINLILENKIFIPKKNFCEQALSVFKSFAIFKNPEFFERQKMRLSTYNVPRYIDCSEESREFLALPRGCLDEIKKIAASANCEIEFLDKREAGQKIDVRFSATLSDEQQAALFALLKNDTGVLFASTGFGKTVLACAAISRLAVNTLVLVHTNALLNQWKKAVKNFLDFDAGAFGGGKNSLTKKIDIALIQALSKVDEALENFLDGYGCVIADECHHVGAFTFEKILKAAKAKKIYGLTATAFRRDGHDKIIFMQCGPVRYKTDLKEVALSHGFEHFFVPRFVPFFPPQNQNAKLSISDCYKFITENTERTKLISLDVRRAIQKGKTPIVISERIEHLAFFAEELSNAADNVITITGKGSAKQKKEALEKLCAVPPNETLIILATGKYIGEGFDNPRLDALFLTMPVSWKGVVDQYAGRLHRKNCAKTEVIIYDYIDFHIAPLERMSHKRIKEYKRLGYKPAPLDGENLFLNKEKNFQTFCGAAIFSGADFKSEFYKSILNAKKEVFVSSPYLSKFECRNFSEIAKEKVACGVKFFVATKTLSKNADEKKSQFYNASIFFLKNAGCKVFEGEKIFEKCAVIDEREVWFGSENLLGFFEEDECTLQIFDATFAKEILAKWAGK